MRTVHRSGVVYERRMAQKRRLRRELSAISEKPVESVHERWLSTEAVEAAIELAEYFRSASYSHAANIAACEHS